MGYRGWESKLSLSPIPIISTIPLSKTFPPLSITNRESMASMASTFSKLSHHLSHSSTSISPPKTPSLYRHSPKTTLSFSSSIQSYATITFCKRNEKMSPLVVSAGVQHLTGSLTRTEGLRFAVVVARFNEVVTKLLLDGALDTFKKYSVGEEDIDVVWVPGSFEVPLVAERLGKLGKYHAVLCIGAVIRGDTSHYDAVANSAASGVLTAGLNSGVPCIFGVLTCDDLDQALNRAGGKSGNKGSEAALTAIEMASLFEHYLK